MLSKNLLINPMLRDVVTGHNELALFVKTDCTSSVTAKYLEGIVNSLDVEDCFYQSHTIKISLGHEDFEECIQYSGLKSDDWVRDFIQVEYQVGLIGFIPDFAYLEGLPKSHRVPRRKQARTKVAKASLAIGGEYVGVYPKETPGGWNCVGYCLELEKLGKLNLGDKVRFVL